jgi:GNAT superfamily N-acetyltransferase
MRTLRLGSMHLKIDYYRMREGQEDEIVNLIYGLINEYGAKFECHLNQNTLRNSKDILNIEVASVHGTIIGFCAWVVTYSTWRGQKGIYLCDLAVTAKFRSNEVSRQLLTLAAKTAAKEGATFIRAEIDITSDDNAPLYEQIGFWSQTRHVMHFLEQDKFNEFIGAAP